MSNKSKPNGNILVVDDTAENLRLLANMLGDRGFEVRPVTSGRQALQVAERSAPDLVLLDITMPGMDGYEVCRRLKEHQTLREVPVIFLTALTDTADKLKAFAAGGVDYISKPFQIDEVLARVNVHLALRQAQRELSRNYERLRDLEKLRDDLVNMIVHDMRSPLAVIMGNLELATMFLGSDISQETAGVLNAASSGVARLSAMTDDLLDVSKMEEGKLTLNRGSCDVMELAREIAVGLSAMDRKRSITIDQGGPVMAYCDAAVVRRILQNLMSNAIKHTPDDSAVRVTADSVGNNTRVSVIDNGCGVPADAREKIFEKFGARVARAEQKYHSVGLGLAFCKLAVEAHGGRIGVEPGDKGGSVFWFELPC